MASVRTVLLAIALLGAAAGTCRAQQPPLPFTEADMAGEWDSGPCAAYVRGPGPEVSAIRRQYIFAPDRYGVRYTFFADPECRHALFTAHLSGRYRLGRVVEGVPAAREIDVFFDRVLLTVEATALLPRVAGCGAGNWEVGVQQDVTERGCLAWRPRTACGMDYDIGSVAGGVFFPGFRTADMCTMTGRPSALQNTAGARRIGAP